MATNGRSGETPTVVIIGAGAAGIFTAYQINKQWPGRFKVWLFESAKTIGGNAAALTVQYGGQPYIIDLGAQFFVAKAQPNYMKLIRELGLENQVRSYPTGLTIWERSTNRRLFWIPARVGGFTRYTPGDWIRLIKFGMFLMAAWLLNRARRPDWTLSVDEWLARLPLGNEFKQNVIRNFLYQFTSLPYARLGEASAVYATTYFVRTALGNLKSLSLGVNPPVFQTSQSLIGLSGILEGALKASGVAAQTGSPVTAVAPGEGGIAVTVNGSSLHARYVVMACDPGTCADLLGNGGTARQDLIDLLRKLAEQYLDLPIVMQKDAARWMPGERSYWEAVNTLVDTPQRSLAFTAWFGPLRPPYDGLQPIPVFKSWGSPDLAPRDANSAFFAHTHNVPLPTTAFMRLRSGLDAYQGQNGLSFAGGWTNWFDSQEAALISAINATRMLDR